MPLSMFIGISDPRTDRIGIQRMTMCSSSEMIGDCSALALHEHNDFSEATKVISNNKKVQLSKDARVVARVGSGLSLVGPARVPIKPDRRQLSAADHRPGLQCTKLPFKKFKSGRLN